MTRELRQRCTALVVRVRNSGKLGAVTAFGSFHFLRRAKVVSAFNPVHCLAFCFSVHLSFLGVHAG